jgi:hypothetical protein
MAGIVIRESAYGTPAQAIGFSHKVVYAGTNACGNATATTTITVTGVLATDLVLITFKVNASSRQVLTVVPSADTITIVASGNTANTDYVYYAVLRAC